MFIEKTGEELLGGGLGSGVGGSPEFLPVPLETHRIGRTPAPYVFWHSDGYTRFANSFASRFLQARATFQPCMQSPIG